METMIARLKSLNACRESIEYASSYSDAQSAWAECQRGDWMLWLLARTDADRQSIVRAACDCARLALPCTSDPRVRQCIETTEAWARGESTLYDVREARAATCAAAYADAAYAAAADAAYAAAAAAAVAAVPAYAVARAAADAATYADAATASDAAAYAATRTAALARCADIVRQRFPTPPVLT